MKKATAKKAVQGELWSGPKSVCSCGHTGDGAGSEHLNTYGPDLSPGHGPCLVPGCECRKFTWEDFRPEYLEAKKRGV